MNKQFEIGLVMAGAVSAGAYTAGVMDFLIEALDEWQREKDANAGVPNHDVKIKVMAGASAGGITSAIATRALVENFPPVRDADSKAAAANKLFDCWVNRIDIEHLLGNRDMQDQRSPLVSLLDSSVLTEIADHALGATGGSVRSYVTEPVHVVTTVSNLRGVPYNISFDGQMRGGHDMSLHADYVHFVASHGGSASQPGALALDWAKQEPSLRANWEFLKKAALASGAFPVGLAPRDLRHEFPAHDEDPYVTREWSIPNRGNNGQGCQSYRRIPPNWPKRPQFPYQYDFRCVDGGLMNNEPLEIARRLLAGPAGHNERDKDKASRAIVMIDPFPGGLEPTDDYKTPEGLLAVILSMFGALQNQARFKPDELALAQDPTVFSRFLVAPTREQGTEPAKFPIACGLLGGFGGFLSRAFRKHDFILGRRNCQRFLARYFILSEDNPLFSDWTNQPALVDKFTITENGERFLPIIPLLGSARHEVKPLPWPVYDSEQFEQLLERIADRYDTVTHKLADEFLRDKRFIRWGAKLAAWRKRGDVIDFIRQHIDKDLRRFQLSG